MTWPSMTWVNTFGLIIAFGSSPFSFLMRFNVAGNGVGVLFVELPLTAGVLLSFVDFVWPFWADEVAVGFSMLGFGDSTGFGLSTFFGLDLLVTTVIVLLALADSAWLVFVSSDFVLSIRLGLDLLDAIVNVDLTDSKIANGK